MKFAAAYYCSHPHHHLCRKTLKKKRQQTHTKKKISFAFLSTGTKPKKKKHSVLYTIRNAKNENKNEKQTPLRTYPERKRMEKSHFLHTPVVPPGGFSLGFYPPSSLKVVNQGGREYNRKATNVRQYYYYYYGGP